ncbi:hypothetical protein SMA5143A_7206 [Streptomyces sp. MA5143a]|nr:hypothetical protein SMA5143A_7206 [Streptomyces sp. MA5143a]
MITIGSLCEEDRAAWEALARGYKAFYRTMVLDEGYEQTWQRLRGDTEFHGIGAWSQGELVGIAHYLFHPTFWMEDSCYHQDLVETDGCAMTRSSQGIEPPSDPERFSPRQRSPARCHRRDLLIAAHRQQLGAPHPLCSCGTTSTFTRTAGCGTSSTPTTGSPATSCLPTHRTSTPARASGPCCDAAARGQHRRQRPRPPHRNAPTRFPSDPVPQQPRQRMPRRNRTHLDDITATTSVTKLSPVPTRVRDLPDGLWPGAMTGSPHRRATVASYAEPAAAGPASHQSEGRSSRGRARQRNWLPLTRAESLSGTSECVRPRRRLVW